MTIRPIEEKDDQAIAQIIKKSLEAVGLDQEGTAYTDPQLNHLTSYYSEAPKSQYFVMSSENKILGGAGYARLSPEIAELQKCYVTKEARRQGIASALIEHLEQEAKEHDYQAIYLESSSLLKEAISFYRHHGYEKLSKPLPNNQNHHAMDIWMMKKL